MKVVVFLIFIGLVFYVLYTQGMLVVNCKRAILFVGSIRGKDSCRASFKSCSGYMKRVIKFERSRAYYFMLDSELEKGELEIAILDSSKQPVLMLNHIQQSGTIEVDARQRYYLVFSFKSASGKYELKWQ